MTAILMWMERIPSVCSKEALWSTTLPGEGRYTAQPGLSGAVEAAWVLANAAAAPLAGQARLYLLSAQADADQKDHYTVIFGYCLNGSAVHLYDDGWAAVFEVTEGVVTDFTIRLALLLRRSTAGPAATCGKSRGRPYRPHPRQP